MSVLLGTEIGLERFAYEALALLISDLPAELAAEDNKWVSLDKAMAVLRKVPYLPCTSDIPDPSNYYPGHRPSLIESTPDKYPNISVLGFRSRPSSDQGDQYYGNSISLAVEAIVIAGPYASNADGSFDLEGEDLVNRKCPRMMESINTVFEKNRTLNGVAFEINNPPQTLITECFRLRPTKGHGDNYYLQMCRLDYTVSKVSAY